MTRLQGKFSPAPPPLNSQINLLGGYLTLYKLAVRRENNIVILSLSHLGLAFVLMLRPFFPELVMSTDLLSFEHPSVLLFCLLRFPTLPTNVVSSKKRIRTNDSSDDESQYEEDVIEFDPKWKSSWPRFIVLAPVDES